MNRKFFLFAVVAMILVAIAACSKDELGVDVIVPQQEQMDSYRVSVDEALRSAEIILRAGDRDTRSAARRVKSTELYVAKPATRSNDNTEVSFYLINYEDNAGYALVSTDERTTPVYMYAEEGNITTEAFEEVPPLAIFMEEAIANYEAEVANYDEPEDIMVPDTLDSPRSVYIDGDFYYINTDTTYVSKGSLTNTLWDQEDPYNHYCNNKPVGCGPVAIGQIMAYHRHPYSTYGTPIDWDAMTSRRYFTSINDNGANDTARLLYLIGTEAGINYLTDNDSGINIYAAEATLRAFGYTCSAPQDYTLYSYLIKNEIDCNRPVYIRGHREGASSGHAWIIDGYTAAEYTKKYYHATPPYNFSHSEGWSTVQYYKQNIGWGLSYNGLSVLETYTEGKKIITGIKPNI